MTVRSHVHDCTGPDARCPCGYQPKPPDIAVAVFVTKNERSLMDDVFMCQSMDEAIAALRNAADQLEIARDCAVTETPRRTQ